MYRIITVLAITLGALGLFDGSEVLLRSACAQTSAAAAPPPGAAPAAAGTPDDAAKATALKAFQRGTAYYKSEEYDKAIEQFESAYQAVPQAVFIYNIAQSHRLAGHAERALGYYRQFLQLSPDAKNRPEIEERITTLERQIGPQLVVPSVAAPTAEPAPAGQLTLDEEQQQKAKQAAAKRRRTTGIALGVIGGVLVVGAAVGLGLYFGLPRAPEVTVFQPVNP